MRCPRFCLVAALLLPAAFGVHAQAPAAAPPAAPDSPYNVTVPVSDVSETQRDQAFVGALGQVLARVAGGLDLRGKPGYDDALKKAPGMVQQYQYQRAGTGLAVRATFDQGAVRRLIQKLGVAPAGDKPPVFAVVRGTDGAALDGDALVALTKAAAAKGITVVYPDPAKAPDPARLAAADPAALAQVTQDYNTGLILIGRLKAGAGDWTLLAGGKSQHWTDQGDTEDAVLADAGGTLASRVGGQLNVVGGAVGDMNLRVAGLNSALDYASLLALLRADPAVRNVATSGADDGAILLTVKAATPAGALAANLAAGGRLVQDGPHDGADASLRWLH